MKQFWKSRTFWINALTLAVGIGGATGVVDLIPPEYTNAFISALGAANVLLRFFTTTPVSLR